VYAGFEFRAGYKCELIPRTINYHHRYCQFPYQMTPPDEFDDWSSWNSWGNFDNSLALDYFQLQEDYNADSGEGEANLGELRGMFDQYILFKWPIEDASISYVGKCSKSPSARDRRHLLACRRRELDYG
jgi:hypothetical protein